MVDHSLMNPTCSSLNCDNDSHRIIVDGRKKMFFCISCYDIIKKTVLKEAGRQ